MEYTEIIISYYKGSVEFHQITFIKDGFIEWVEPFELKHHCQWLNNDVTIFVEI